MYLLVNLLGGGSGFDNNGWERETIARLWFIEWRPGLDPQVAEGGNPTVSPPHTCQLQPVQNLCYEKATWTLPAEPSRHILSSRFFST